MDSSHTAGVAVPKRILNNLLSALEAGVVPRSGAPYIAIGRGEEIKSLLENLETVSDGGAVVRFLIGRYGSGKSFLIQLIRGYALDRDFLCADADLSPERKLSGAGGIATYRELMRNFASKAAPDGGALPLVLSRFYNGLREKLVAQGMDPESSSFQNELKKEIHAVLSEMETGIGGFEFARVLGAYFTALSDDHSEIKSACLRWLRGEFATKTEARAALGFAVGGIIDDANWYEYLKLWAALSAKIGYHGLIVYVDECINLYKIPNRISREANYEKLLAVFNDTLQGRAAHLGVFFGGTPQFLEDTRRGLFSYEALRSRLEDSRFVAEGGFRNLSAPVMRLRRLSDNELLALIARLSRLYAQKYNTDELVSEKQMQTFLQYELSRAGAQTMVTPREMIRDFLSLLSVLRENPGTEFETLVKLTAVSTGIQEEEDIPSGSTSAAQPINSSASTVKMFDIDI